MDMNRAFFEKTAERDPRWHLIDASGKVVGRLATEIANLLRGKGKPEYTPHNDSGDYVVVINAEKVVFTGDKLEDKEYIWHTGWMGGQKVATPKEKLQKDPAFLIMHAVKGMLQKENRIARKQLTRLNVYAGSAHPHAAQLSGFAPVKYEAQI